MRALQEGVFLKGKGRDRCRGPRDGEDDWKREGEGKKCAPSLLNASGDFVSYLQGSAWLQAVLACINPECRHRT